MVTIGSKVQLDAIKEAIWKNEPIAIKPEPKSRFSDLEKADLLECCYTWQYAYKAKRSFPKTARMWLRIENLIKKLQGLG